MSSRVSDHHYRADSGRVVAHGHPRGRARPSDYTVAHGKRQIRLGPVSFWIVVGSLVIMGVWSLATGTYFAFHDDVLARLLARQAEQRFAYEDRIAELRAQVDRITSRQLLDQEQFERRLEQLARRQAVLESRASQLNTMNDPTVTGSIGRNRPARLPEPQPNGTLKPSPISDTVIFTAPPDREARLESRGVAAPAQRYALASSAAGSGVEAMLMRVQASLDNVETRQTSTLNALEESYDGKIRRMRGVLSDLGIHTGRMPASARGMGGPFIPATVPAQASAFERQLFRIKIARANLDQLHRTLTAVPVRKPIMGEIDLTSTFGIRSDPFGRGPAMHSGLDFRSNVGDPVRATAVGTVVAAGWNGGYGKMVEIDHGSGLSTRYGHLSAIDVKVGQHVRNGQVIGRVGSTGRSTGPHLHYETRINDTPVDPQKFLRAGLRLGSAF